MNKQKGNILMPVLIIGSIILSTLGIVYNTSTNYKDELQMLETQNAILKADLDTTKEVTSAKLGAFRPSNYVGKLLTRLNEGGVESSFQTTPGTARDGSTLTTAKIGDFLVFTINPGAANEEKISASAVSVSGTTATWTIINRGLSFTENVAVTANKKQHAVGETVIISNDDHYLTTQYPSRDGDETITGQWTFTTVPITASTTYADESTVGSVELATNLEAASGTINGGSGKRLSLGANLASSTYNASASHVIVVTNSSNKIDTNFIDASLFTGFAANATSTIITTTGTSTWTKLSNAKLIQIIAIGGGGGGGGSVSESAGGGGGGGAAVVNTIFDASVLPATTTVTVGVGGLAGTTTAGYVGGDTAFGTYVISPGGLGGAKAAGSTGGIGGNSTMFYSGGGLASAAATLACAGGGGGTALAGGAGGRGTILCAGGGGGGDDAASPAAAAGGIQSHVATSSSIISGGNGGNGGSTAAGAAGGLYGGGGGGAADGSSGGAGGNGAIQIITYY